MSSVNTRLAAFGTDRRKRDRWGGRRALPASAVQRDAGSAAVNAMVERVAPAILELLADGTTARTCSTR